MKLVLLTCLAICCVAGRPAATQRDQPKPAADKPQAASNTVAVADPDASLPTDPEERFKALLTNASLSGRWAPLKDGELGEEKGGDKYTVVSATKLAGERWIISARMKYRSHEFVLPIPVRVHFAGDTAILSVDTLTIPGGGSYSARVMFHERTYSGVWTGGRDGGMIYGTITNVGE
jgi:hypothetical protein